MSSSIKLRIISGISNTLVYTCIFYMVAMALIVTAKAWGIAFILLLAMPVLNTVLWNLFLAKEKTLSLVIIAFAVLYIAQTFFFVKVSSTGLSFKYLLMMIIGSGIFVGLPLYFTLNEITLQKHLMGIDYMVLCVAFTFLVRGALNITLLDSMLITGVLILDIFVAAYMRINEVDSVDVKDSNKAITLTLCCTAVPALIAMFASMLFSKSKNASLSVFKALGVLLKNIWILVEAFFKWIFSHFSANSKYDSLTLEEMVPIADIENNIQKAELNIDFTFVVIMLAIIVLAVLLVLAILFRKSKLGSKPEQGVINASVRRSKISQISIWARLKARLIFELDVIRNRNSAASVFIYLERRARRKKMPRTEAETMREFISRVDKGNGLAALADALDANYYSHASHKLSDSECNAMRQYIKNVIQ